MFGKKKRKQQQVVEVEKTPELQPNKAVKNDGFVRLGDMTLFEVKNLHEKNGYRCSNCPLHSFPAVCGFVTHTNLNSVVKLGDENK